MPASPVDPGYGDPKAPVGSTEWAKRWRLMFQGAAKQLPEVPGRALRFYRLGMEHRAWTLLTKEDGKTAFADFDTFCAYPQPWGLGLEPAKFKAYLAAEEGKNAMELETVAPDGRAFNGPNQHTGPREESGNDCPIPLGVSDRKQKN